MKEPLLKAVVSPPELFFAPFFLAFMNAVVQVALFSMYMAFSVVNPLWLFPPVVGVHFIIALYSKQEPHLSTILQSSGPFVSGSKNMIKSKGFKIAP